MAAAHPGNVGTLARVEHAISSMTEGFVGLREEIAIMKSEQGNQKAQIASIEADWKSELGGVRSSVGEIVKRMDERDRPKTSFWISAFSALFFVASSMVAVGVFFVSSSIREATLPIQQRVAGLEALTSDHRELEEKTARSAASDARSEQDRGELNRRLAVIETQVIDSTAQRREQYAALSAGFVESETQFKNLTALVYSLWEKAYGKPFPIIAREVSPYGKAAP